jgi:hypothetical protein
LHVVDRLTELLDNLHFHVQNEFKVSVGQHFHVRKAAENFRERFSESIIGASAGH